MAADCSSVPARYVIRSYLRQQDISHRHLREALRDELIDFWKRSYGGRRLQESALEALGAGFEKALREAGGFQVDHSVTLPSPAAPYRHRHSVSAFLGAPMSTLRDLAGTDVRESSLMIDFLTMDFTPKKALFGLGFTGLLLTRHVLERIYERTEIANDEFGALLHDHLSELIKGVGIAQIAGLWLDGSDPLTRTTAVPYANGLMILDNRLLAGNTDDGEFGCRYTFPPGRMSVPFISRQNLIDRLGANHHLPRNSQMGLLTCGVTYLDLGILGGEQQDYYYAFRALEEVIGNDRVRASIYAFVAPQLPQDQPLATEIPASATFKAQRARALLESWLEPREYNPICTALTYED